MIYPQPLAPGACVGLIAPASPVTPQERRNCEICLRSLGFRVITGESLKRDDNLYGYLAGTAIDRANDINYMFADPGVEAIFCVRGGYGSSQVLPYLDYDCIRRNPKIFVGYSDVTSLHTVLQRYCGLVTFHGPMVKPDLCRQTRMDACGIESEKHAEQEKDSRLKISEEYMLRSLFTALSGNASWVFKNPPGEKLRVLVPGYAQGILTGGNLSVLARSLGTPYAPMVDGKILFLEDIGESVSRIHMYLMQMQYAGVFQGVRGILLGNFTDCSGVAMDTSGSTGKGRGSSRLWTIEKLLEEFFKKIRIPVVGNVCSDHRYPMGTLPFGMFCVIETPEGEIPRIEFGRHEHEWCYHS